jgi:putative Ig domain-containing protein/uncharacterized protein DUF11
MRKFWRPESPADLPGSRPAGRGRRWIGPRAGAALLALTAALGLMTAVSSWGATAQAATLQVTTTSLPAASSNGNGNYAVQLTAAGGTAPYTWALESGSLPPGFELGRDGVIMGAIAQLADDTSTFTVQVTDSGSPPQTATQQLTMTSYGPPEFSTSTLPDATAGVAYSGQATAFNGDPPYTWALTGGQLPPGLTLNADGVVSGTPTQSGTFTFVLEVLDSLSPPVTDAQAWTLTVNPAAPLAVTTTSLPGADNGLNYDVQLTAAGGIAPYTWTLESGSLPPGFHLLADGELLGSYAQLQSVTTTFTVQVADSESPAQTATQQLTLTAYGPPAVTTTALPDATAGFAYSGQLTESGGEAPFSWSQVAGQLPPGLTLSAAGVVSGTPTQSGTFTFVPRVTDSESPPQSDTQSVTITVNPAAPLAVTTASLPAATAGTAYSQALSATGGTTPYTWSLSGTLPAGLTLSTGGTISGTPKTAGTSTFTVKVSDAENPAQTATRQLSITVAADKADLAVAVTGPASAKPGTAVTDTITVTDRGPAPATKVTVDLGTTGLAGVKPSAGGSTKSVTVLGVTLTATTWSLATLAPGQQVTFTVTGTVPAKGIKAASAAGLALSSTADPDLLNNAGATSTKITG